MKKAVIMYLWKQMLTPRKVHDVTLDGILYDMALAEEIKAYFPLTISAVGYGGREEITFSLTQ